MYLSGSLQRPEERARVHLCDRVEGELERRDDREAAPAAAQGPEQVVLALGVGVDDPAVRGHRLDGEDAVAREAVAARQPADPTAERVADHADVLGRARQRRQPLLGRGGHDLAPERAGPERGPVWPPRRSRRRACARSLRRIVPSAAPSARRCGPFPAARAAIRAPRRTRPPRRCPPRPRGRRPRLDACRRRGSTPAVRCPSRRRSVARSPLSASRGGRRGSR